MDKFSELDGFDEVKKYFQVLLGPDNADKVMKEISQNPELYFAAPETHKAKIEDFTKECLDNISINTLVMNIISKLPDILQLTIETQRKTRTRDLENIKTNSGAKYFLDIVTNCEDEQIRNNILKMLSIVDAIDIVDLTFGGPHMARLIEAGENDPDSITFEERVRAVTSAIVYSSEKVYRPFIRSALLITKMLSMRNIHAPTTLGAVLSEAKTFWHKHYPMLTDLLIDQIGVIRNSDAHKHTKYNPRNGTVTFIDMKDGKMSDCLELSDQDFQLIVGRYLNLCLVLFSMFNETKRLLSV